MFRSQKYYTGQRFHNPESVLISPDKIQLLEDVPTLEFGTIPEGYIWDGATLSKFAFIPKFSDKYNRVTLKHDYAYDFEGVMPNDKVYTRKKIDVMLLSGLLSAEMNPYHAEYVYRLVRIFGGLLWPRKKQ